MAVAHREAGGSAVPPPALDGKYAHCVNWSSFHGVASPPTMIGTAELCASKLVPSGRVPDVCVSFHPTARVPGGTSDGLFTTIAPRSCNHIPSFVVAIRLSLGAAPVNALTTIDTRPEQSAPPSPLPPQM